MPGISIEKPRGHEMPEWFSSESETVLSSWRKSIRSAARVNASPATAASIILSAPSQQDSFMTVMCSSEHLFELALAGV